MVAPHLRNKAEKAVSNDGPDGDVVRDIAAPRLGEFQPPALPLPASDTSALSLLKAEAPPAAAPVASHYTDQELAAGRRKMRYKFEHPQDGQKGLSRQAAWRQYPCLYIGVPRNGHGVPLPSPVLEGHDNDQIMADALDSGNTDPSASNALPPPALPLHGAQVPPATRVTAASPTPSSSNIAATDAAAFADADLPRMVTALGDHISETLDTLKLRNISRQLAAAVLRHLAVTLSRAAQLMEDDDEPSRE